MDRITFKVNGRMCSVGSEVSSDVTLLDYIRSTLELRGTKYMCREAGCGACVVAAATSPCAPLLSFNSCMVPITACEGWEVVTIEQLGNRQKGYHILQKTLAEHNGTQCGYCSPGWVMAMYCVLQSKKDLTMQEIEQSFASNVCRCTGYRSILDAFKTFAKDSPKCTVVPDIEDLKVCQKTGQTCEANCTRGEWVIVSKDDVTETVKEIKLKDNKYWYRVNNVGQIFDTLKRKGFDSYMLLAGNTGKGVYPIDEYPQVLIDINKIPELTGYVIDQNLIIGSRTTLTQLSNICQSLAGRDDFRYLQKLYEHLKLVAHIAVKNAGSIAGNLMLKYMHHSFQSDIYLLFETVGAQLTLLNDKGAKQTVTMQQFLKTDMKRQIIFNILLPPLGNNVQLVTFKVMPRSQNCHAIVHAGFMYKFINPDTVSECRVVYGGLSAEFTRAYSTEAALVGKPLFNNETLQFALKVLSNEMVVNDNPPELSAAYRKQLALGLFYKGLLRVCPTNLINPSYRSEVPSIHDTRPVSRGRQVYNTDPSLWPLNQPLPKLEALIQCAGEAKYTEDEAVLPHQVSASFVLSSVPKGNIVSIDPSKALRYPGVIAFYTANDIPGLNSFTPADDPEYTLNEEVLSSGEIKYYNQPIGIIVAETQYIADRVVKLVNVTYNNVSKPVLDIKIAKKDQNRVTNLATIDAKDKGTDVAKVINGGNTIRAQCHFTMENISCITEPTEEGLRIHATAQWMDALQVMISRALNIDENKVDVHVRRVGGAYGLKISRTIQVAVACSLVTQKLNRPCRFILPLPSTTRAVGKRFPCSSDFEIGVNKSGVIQYMNYNVYEDNGYTVNEKMSQFGVTVFNNCYNSLRWNYKCYDTTTDTAKNTWFRSPGTLESIAMIELVMEQISYALNLDPLIVKLNNLDPKYDLLREMIESVKSNGDYYKRRMDVNKFNVENRWRKRGLRFSLLRWTHVYSRYFGVNMSVYHGDGTVSIIHGGIEIGQGINTKAAQICAYMLDIPLDKVQVKPNSTIITPNAAVTGGSLTSQNIGIGVEKCCQELLKRLEPIKNEMNNPSWEVLIAKAFESGIDLQTHGFTGNEDVVNYDVYGVTLAEIEVDILTGEFEVLRVDMLEDCGQSVNPEIDVGQLEGAFVMGLGYWTSENLIYNPDTGELLTDRTWNYYVPQARDIPQDFRVYFRKKSYTTRKIFGSKVTGEPGTCMAVAVPLAIREAIVSARANSGVPSTKWFSMDGPFTVEKICLASSTKIEDFKFY